MNSSRATREPHRTHRVAGGAILGGGLVMAALFVPFTVAHGPTSFNEERVVLGLDMHGWGLLLGLVPNVLIAGGLWWARHRLTGDRRASAVMVTIVCGAFLLDAFGNVVMGGLGAPFILFVLAPALCTLAVLIPASPYRSSGPRMLLAALGATLSVGVALALVDEEASDAVGGFRIFGIVVYGLGGLLWALIGASLAHEPSRADPRAV